jgi:hypothetical protein
MRGSGATGWGGAEHLDEGEQSNWMRGSGETGVEGAEQLVQGEKKLSSWKKVVKFKKKLTCSKTRTGNRYQARSNFDVTSFWHPSSFSSSRSNRNVTSFRSDMGTDQRTDKPTDGPTDQRTNGRTNIVSYRGATSRLKIVMSSCHVIMSCHYVVICHLLFIILVKPLVTI